MRTIGRVSKCDESTNFTQCEEQKGATEGATTVGPDSSPLGVSIKEGTHQESATGLARFTPSVDICKGMYDLFNPILPDYGFE